MSEVEFGSLFSFIKNGMNVKQDKSGDGLPISRIETIWNSSIDPSRVGFAGLSESNCKDWLLQPGDLLFSHINSVEHIGKCAIYEGTPEKLVHGMNLLCLRANPEKINPKYARILIRSPGFRSKLSNFINKAVNQASVSIGNLSKISVQIPSLPEQHRIAAILDQAEALRAKRRQALAKLDELGRSIFLEMFGDPVTNSKEWPKSSLKDCTKQIQIGPFGSLLHQDDYISNGIPLINPKHIQEGRIVPSLNESITEKKHAELTTYHLRAGDVIMGRRGEMGRCAIVEPKYDGYICGTGSLYIRPDDQNKVLPIVQTKNELN